MSTGFAGSRHLDERRRRRLATDAGDPPLPLKKRGNRQNVEEVGTRRLEAPSRSLFPVRKLISRKPWKILAVATGVLLAGLGVFSLVMWSGVTPVTHGPAVYRLLEPGSSPLPSLFVSGCLLGASQLCLVIAWSRSQSRADFEGQYQSWYWAAGLLMFFALVSAARLHFVWGELAPAFWRVNLRNWPTLCWLLPLGLPAWILLVKLRRDVAHHLPTWTLLSVVGVLLLSLAAFPLKLWQGLPTDWEQPLQIGGGMLVAWVLFAACLWHARYVIYVCADPPAEQTAWWKRVWNRQRWQKWIPQPRTWANRWKERREERRAQRDQRRATRDAEKAERQAAKQAAKAAAQKAREDEAAARQAAAEQKAAEKEAARLAAREAKQQARRAKKQAAVTDEQPTHPSEAPSANDDAKSTDSAVDQTSRKHSAKSSDTTDQRTKDADEPQSHRSRKNDTNSDHQSPTKQVANRSQDSRKQRENKASAETPEETPSDEPQIITIELESTSGDVLPFEVDLSQSLTSDMMKGLSKSQRRRLRKEFREAQRQRRAA